MPEPAEAGSALLTDDQCSCSKLCEFSSFFRLYRVWLNEIVSFHLLGEEFVVVKILRGRGSSKYFCFIVFLDSLCYEGFITFHGIKKYHSYSKI